MSNHRAQNQDEMEILGYTFGEIRRAQQGGRLGRPVDSNAPPDQDLIRHRDSDLLLLQQHGADGLEKMQYHGALSRLRRQGVLPSDTMEQSDDPPLSPKF